MTNKDWTHLISEQVTDYGFSSIINEGVGKKYYLEGIFGEAELINRNMRKYPLKVMQEAVNQIQPRLQTKQKILGELEHPKTATIHRRNACIKILDLHMEGNRMMGRAEVLDEMPNGKILIGLINADQEMFVSTRALGSVTESSGFNLVNEMSLVTVDVVDHPSCQTAAPDAIYESVNWLHNIGGITDTEAELLESVKRSHSATTFKKTCHEVTNNILEGWNRPLQRAFLKLNLSSR